MKADYDVTWDKDGFFQNAKSNTQKRNSRIPEIGAWQYRNEGRSSYISRYSPEDVRSKRFKVKYFNELVVYTCCMFFFNLY